MMGSEVTAKPIEPPPKFLALCLLSMQDYIGADIPLLSCGDALVLISFRQRFIHSTHCFISFTLPGRESGKKEGQ